MRGQVSDLPMRATRFCPRFMPPRSLTGWSPLCPSSFFRGLVIAALVLSTRAADVSPRMLLLDGAQPSPTNLIVVGERATILYSGDSAHTWQSASLPIGLTATLTGISFEPDATHAWAVGHDAIILATSDAGHSWQKSWQSDNLTESFLDVLAVNARHIIAIGAYGLYVETTDAGATWHRRKILAEDLHLNHITRGPTGTLYLAGERGTLLRSKDDGTSWQPIESPYDGSFYGILPLAQTTLVAHGLRGRLYRSDDDGRTWHLISVSERVLLASALKLKNDTVLFAGQARAFFASHDQARTVAAQPVSFTSAVATLIELADGRILALGEAGVTVFTIPTRSVQP